MKRTLAAIRAEKSDPVTALKRHTRVNSAMVGVREALDDLADSLGGLDEKWSALEAAREEFEKAVRSSRQPVSLAKAAAELCRMEHATPSGTSARTLHEIASVLWG